MSEPRASFRFAVKRTVEWAKIIFSERMGIRATNEKALQRRDHDDLLRKTESVMKSKGYRNLTNKNQETPDSYLLGLSTDAPLNLA